MGEFAQQLAVLRKKAGFPTAWKFYTDNGGRGFWPFTFVHYGHIEDGKTLPSPDHLLAIITSLRLPHDMRRTEDLFTAYLREYLGGGDGAACILNTLFSAKNRPTAPATANSKLLETGTVNITPAQFRAMSSDEVAYWCAMTIMNDAELYTPAALAARTGYPEGKVRKALEVLCEARFAEKAGPGKYRNRFGGRTIIVPRHKSLKDAYERADGYVVKRENEAGRLCSNRYMLFRSETAQADMIGNHLSRAVLDMDAYTTTVKTPETKMYMVRATLTEMGDL